MTKRSKSYRAAAEKVHADVLYTPFEAMKLAKETTVTKFDSTVEVVFRLGVDPRQADQMVRGTVSLPHGTGKTARVLVFAVGPRAQEAIDAGADEVGGAIYSLVSDIKEEVGADEVRVTEGLALISVVSRNMGRRSGTAGRIFSALGEAGINISMISQSSQEITIILGVAEKDFEDAIRVIYDKMVRDEMVGVSAAPKGE